MSNTRAIYGKPEEKKSGNPTWIKGKSGNPKGRPKGQNSVSALYQDANLFILIKHNRWERFCLGLMEPPYTKTAAARKAGYSPRSARFIACRLWKKPTIREIFRRIHERADASREIDGGVWLIPDYSGHYHIYRSKSKGRH